MTEATAWLIELRPRQTRHPYTGKLHFTESGKELFEMVEHGTARREKRIKSNVNRLCAADHQRWYSNSIVRESQPPYSLLWRKWSFGFRVLRNDFLCIAHPRFRHARTVSPT
jgi:hypothetical protein